MMSLEEYLGKQHILLQSIPERKWRIKQPWDSNLPKVRPLLLIEYSSVLLDHPVRHAPE